MSNYLRGKAYGFIEELIKEIAVKKAEVNLTGSNLEGNREVAEQVAELDIKKLKARNHVTKGFIEAVQKRITGDETLMLELMDLYVALSEKPDPKPDKADFEFILEDDDATFSGFDVESDETTIEFEEIKPNRKGKTAVVIGGETCWIPDEDYQNNPNKYVLALGEE